jgi:hypothetical protein
MIRFHAPFDGKRLIGDKKNKIFHDALYEAGPAKSNCCQIADLPPEDVQTFDPDSPVGAIEQGFAPCPTCFRTEHGPCKQDSKPSEGGERPGSDSTPN